MTTLIDESKDYLQTLEDIKQRVKTAQIKAHLSVNKEMLILYWQIGKVIVERQEKEKWGAKITRKLSKDLSNFFSNMKGFSYTNLRYMQRFAESYPDLLICPQTVGKLVYTANSSNIETKTSLFINEMLGVFLNIPWGHNRELLDKLKNQAQRLWYAQKTIQNGWSRNVLSIQIETDLYKRQGDKEIKANNFALTLPTQDSDLAFDIFKDEYNFEFIDNKDDLLKERAIEKALIDDIIKFLTELGKGFACKDENTSNEIKDKSLKCMIRPMGVANYKLAKNEEIPKELEPLEGLKKLI